MSTKFCKNPAGVSSHQQQPVTSHCCCSGPGNDCLLLLASARSINCLSSATTRIITHVDTRRSFATFQPFELYPFPLFLLPTAPFSLYNPFSLYWNHFFTKWISESILHLKNYKVKQRLGMVLVYMVLVGR